MPLSPSALQPLFPRKAGAECRSWRAAVRASSGPPPARPVAENAHRRAAPALDFAVTILCRFMEMEATYHGLCATVKYQFPEGLQWSLVVARKRLLKSEICFNKGCTERDTEASDPFQMCKQCRRCVIAFALRIRDTHTPASG